MNSTIIFCVIRYCKKTNEKKNTQYHYMEKYSHRQPRNLNKKKNLKRVSASLTALTTEISQTKPFCNIYDMVKSL